MQINELELINLFPTASSRQLNSAIKYQEKFSLTLENLKCLNPDCNNMRSWKTTSSGFGNCCSKLCTQKMRKFINISMIEKMKITNRSIYGYDHPLQCSDIKNKVKKQFIRKYGVDNPSKLHATRDKAKETYFNKTGYYYPSQNPEIKKIIFEKTHSIKWTDRDYWLANFIYDKKFILDKAMKFSGYCQPACHAQLKRLKIKTSRNNNNSLKEQSLYPLLNDLELVFETNNRNIIPTMELDIYLPELNLAIEYNGSYWHSYHETIGTSPKQTDFNHMKYRHQQKSIACIEHGIRLLHIYEYQTEDEILNKLESFLLYEPNLLGDEVYDLDSGCYPLEGIFEIIEPEPRYILKDRIIWNAGKIKINKGN